MSDHDHAHGGIAPHDHVTYTTQSLISARMCDVCGAIIAHAGAAQHQVFHDRLAWVEHHTPPHAIKGNDAPPATEIEEAIVVSVLDDNDNNTEKSD